MTEQTINLDTLTVVNTKIEYAKEISRVIRLTFDVDFEEECEHCIGPQAVMKQLQRFPEGQFVALLEEGGRQKVVGTAHTMRTHKAPSPGTWLGTIGNVSIANHQPAGEWLYGVEMAVHPDYRRFGIGTALYKARFALCKRLNLRGWYSGGMLMGYVNYAHKMPVREYGRKVIQGEIYDPTVSMQMRRGFKALEVIENYLDYPDCGNAAVLIVWENPDYAPKTTSQGGSA